MNRYTIHCTPEQTSKALELGAPIYEAMSRYNARNAIQRVESGKETLEEYAKQGIALVNREYVKKALKIPTAEQMIGWLEEQGIHIYVHKIYSRSCHCYRTIIGVWETKNYNTILHKDYFSNKEATFAAIDAALEYLENLKH